MGKYLEINLVLLKEILCFSFDMAKCLTCVNIFFCCLSPSFMGLACSSYRLKLFILNELDTQPHNLDFAHGLNTFLFLTSEKLNCRKVEFM